MDRREPKQNELHIGSYEDIILARQKARAVALEMGFPLLDQTRIVTAVSELARNIVVHAREGTMQMHRVSGSRNGLRIVFDDKGPGIADVERALNPGFSTAGSLGLGLPGARKLSDSMEIVSAPGKGTTVTIVKWL